MLFKNFLVMTSMIISYSRKKICNCFSENLKAFTFFVILSLTTTDIFSQQKITGTITGIDHASLFGATVSVKNTNRATTTDAIGYFSIIAKKGDLLTISFVGYMTKEIKVENETVLKISL